MESNIKYKPKFGRVLIKREIETKTKGGILLTEDTAKRNANCTGVLIALGETAGWVETYDENLERVPIQTLKVGQKVIFGRYSGTWLDATYGGGKDNDDGTLFMCADGDILAVIEE